METQIFDMVDVVKGNEQLSQTQIGRVEASLVAGTKLASDRMTFAFSVIDRGSRLRDQDLLEI